MLLLAKGPEMGNAIDCLFSVATVFHLFMKDLFVLTGFNWGGLCRNEVMSRTLRPSSGYNLALLSQYEMAGVGLLLTDQNNNWTDKKSSFPPN